MIEINIRRYRSMSTKPESYRDSPNQQWQQTRATTIMNTKTLNLACEIRLIIARILDRQPITLSGQNNTLHLTNYLPMTSISIDRISISNLRNQPFTPAQTPIMKFSAPQQHINRRWLTATSLPRPRRIFRRCMYR